MVLFDPQGVYLPNVSTANPGKRIEYVSSSAISLYKDQFFPYCAFGCDMKSSFPGTLFRFPLRNADQASNSKLSKQAYLEDDISAMLFQLYEEGVFALLFLKSVLSIEMYVWNAGDPEPRKLYSCSVDSANDDIIWHRQALLRDSKSTKSSECKMDAFSLDFFSETVVGNQSQKRIDTFYIVQTMASTSSRIASFAAAASRDYDINLLPWASVAACISKNSSTVILFFTLIIHPFLTFFSIFYPCEKSHSFMNIASSYMAYICIVSHMFAVSALVELDVHARRPCVASKRMQILVDCVRQLQILLGGTDKLAFDMK